MEEFSYKDFAASEKTELKNLTKLMQDFHKMLELEVMENSPTCLKHWVSDSKKGLLINHNNCLYFMDIHGCREIYKNVLFYEGEISVRNVEWNEDDYILKFDICYFVHRYTEEYIYYYKQDKERLVCLGTKPCESII